MSRHHAKHEWLGEGVCPDCRDDLDDGGECPECGTSWPLVGDSQ